LAWNFVFRRAGVTGDDSDHAHGASFLTKVEYEARDTTLSDP
jgi:hypothetical protein